MTSADFFLEVSYPSGARHLRNMALYGLVGPHPEGGCNLYPRSQNQRYDGVAIHVMEGMEAFVGLPGFILMETSNHEIRGKILVNMAKVTHVSKDGERSLLNFVDSTARLQVESSFDEVKAALAQASGSTRPHREA